MNQAEPTVRFTRAGVVRGARTTVPIALGVAAFGVVFGVLARQAGLTTAEAGLMSGLVFAGASQFVALELWVHPVPVVTIVLATLVVNLRHILMGAALHPWFHHLRPGERYGSAAFMADEAWAVTVTDLRAGGGDAGVLLGSGLVLYGTWVASTLVGAAAGAAVTDPARYGLDFAFTAIFLTLLVSLWDGRHDVVPWTVAALVAAVASWGLPGQWYILMAGVAGAVTAGVLRG